MLAASSAIGGVLPAGAASGAQLMAAGLAKYRELLRSLRPLEHGGAHHTGEHDTSSLFQQAKSRVLGRIRERRDRAGRAPCKTKH